MRVEPTIVLNLGARVTPEADMLRIEAEHAQRANIPFNIANRLFAVVSIDVDRRGCLMVGLVPR